MNGQHNYQELHNYLLIQRVACLLPVSISLNKKTRSFSDRVL
jgi:hypothetical protein